MAQKIVKPSLSVKQNPAQPQQPVNLLFGKSNYQLFAVSVLIVIIGFVLMAGTTDIYSNTKIVVAPLLVLAGFALGFVAILKQESNKA